MQQLEPNRRTLLGDVPAFFVGAGRGAQVSRRSRGRPGTVGARASAVLACIGLALVLGAVARSAPARVPLSFGRPTSYDGGPFTLMISDLNHDGRPDLVTDEGAHLNLGGGRFGDYYEIGDHTAVFAGIGDLNGDGAPDFVGLKYEESVVAVLLNRGDGTFGASTEYRAGRAPTDVAIGDLNGDGAADLATANKGENTTSVLLNRGDGIFFPHVDLPVGSRPGSIAIRDLNGDGRLDLIVTNVGSNTLWVLLNRGDGTFQPRSDYPTAESRAPFRSQT
jgi:FG-GAP-like repeat